MKENHNLTPIGILFSAAMFILFSISSSDVIAGWITPSTYSECVEKYVKNTKCDAAARLVHLTCRQQFIEMKQSSDWKNFYSCIRKNIKDVEIDIAASMIYSSCKDKYPQLFDLFWDLK